MRKLIVLSFAVSLAGCGGGSTSPTAPSLATSAPTTAATPTPTPAPTPVPMASVSGGWTSEARSWDFQLEQSGSTLTGIVVGFKNVSYPNDPSVFNITGTVSPSGAVSFTTPNLIFAIDFTGQLDASGRRIVGTLYDCVQTCRDYGEVLVRQ